MADWYLWKNAPGPTHDGTSWTNAWTDFSAVSFTGMAIGDRVLISGGPSGCLYATSLVFTSTARTKATLATPLRFEAATDVGHTGRIYWDAQRTPLIAVDGFNQSQPLPFYGQDASTYAPNGGSPGATPHSAVANAIDCGSSATNYMAHLVFDGITHGRIVLRGFSNSAINLSKDAQNCTFRHLWLEECGDWQTTSFAVDGVTITRALTRTGQGVTLSGGVTTGHTFEDVVICHPAQDMVKQRSTGSSIGGPVGNVTYRRVWMFNSRVVPVSSRAGIAFNDSLTAYNNAADVATSTFGSHVDSSQIFDKSSSVGSPDSHDVWLWDACVHGPNVRSGGQLGEPNVTGLTHVTIQDNLTYGTDSWAMQALATQLSPQLQFNWTINHVTVDRGKTDRAGNVLNSANGAYEFAPRTMDNFVLENSVFHGAGAMGFDTPTAGTAAPTYTNAWRHGMTLTLAAGTLANQANPPGYKDRSVHAQTWLNADFALDGSGADPATQGAQALTSPLDIVGRATSDYWMTLPLTTDARGCTVPDFWGRLKPTNYAVAVASANEALCLVRFATNLYRAIHPTLAPYGPGPTYLPTMHGLNTAALDAALNTEAQRIATVNVTRTAYTLPAT